MKRAATPEGFPIILLHGFPDDVRAWDEVTPPLVKAGFRVLVPYLRGYGPTRFRDAAAPRMAEQAAIGQDVIDFADALRLPRFAVAGYDWGGRAAAIAAALHPDRVRATVLIGGYTIQNTVAPSQPAAPEAEQRVWYQWYFNTERGRAGLQANRHALCRLLWQTWSPTWRFSDDTYNRTAVSFDNPDFVDVVIHSYRHRIGNAPGEPRFLQIEKQLAERPKIEAPVDHAVRRRRWTEESDSGITTRRTAQRSPHLSRAVSSPGRDTSCRAKSPRPCRRRCWSCWRRDRAGRSVRLQKDERKACGVNAQCPMLNAKRAKQSPDRR